MMRPTGEDAGGELDSLDPPIEILDPQLARELQECRCWIESVTGKQFGNKDFHTALEDGTLLCKLMQKIQPGSIKKINNLPTPYAKLDNLNLFLRACLDLGLTRNQLFEPSDLTDLTTRERRDPEEERNRLKNVAITLYWLGKTSEEFPSFPGPYLNRDLFRNVNIQSPSSTMDIYGAPPSGHSNENVYSYKHRPQDSIDSTISQDSSSSVDRGQLSGSLDSDDQQDPRARMGDDMMSRRAAGYLPRPLKKRISESHMFLPPKGGFLSKSNPELNKTYPMKQNSVDEGRMGNGRRKSSSGDMKEEEEEKSLTYEDYKKEKTKLNEDSDLWRSTLDTWKLRRKSKSSADLWAKKEEWEKDKVAELDTTSRRKSKTFQEIVDEKGGPDIGDVAIQLLRKKREQELSDEYAAALDERERAENDDNVFNGEDSEPPARSWRPQPQPRNVRREDPWSDDEQPSRNVPTNKGRPPPPPRRDSFKRGPAPPPREDSVPKASPAKPSWQRPEPSRQQPTQSWQRPEPARQRSDQSWQRPEPSWQRPPPPKPSARDLPEENKENSESVSNIRSMWQRMEQEDPKEREKELPRVPRPMWARESPPAQPIRARDSPRAQPIRARDSSPEQPIRASQSPLSRMTAKQKMEEVANRPVRWEFKEGYMVTNLNLSKSSDEKGFGFAVSGGKDDKAPVLISSVVPGGSASRSQLQVGDEILAINEEDVSPFNHNTVVAAIRDSAKTGIISLYIRRKGAERNAFASLAKELEANDGFPEDEPDSPAPPPRPPPPVDESPVVRQEKVRVDQTALSQQLNRLEDEVKEEPVTRAVKARDDGALAERIERLEGEVKEEPVTRAVKARDDRSLAERIERLDKLDRKDGTWQSKEWRVDPPGQHMEISLLKDDPELQPKPEVVLRRRDTESELASQNLKRRSDFFLGVDAKAEEAPPAEVEKLQSKLSSYTPPQIDAGYKPLESRPRSYNLEDERNRLAEWQRSQEERQREQFQKQQEQFKVDYENRLKKSIERKKSDPALLYAPKPWASVKPPVSKSSRPSGEEEESKTLQDRSSWEQQQLQLREQQRKAEEEQQRKLAEEEQQRRWEEEQQRKREAEEQRRREEEEQQRRWEEEQQRRREEEQQRREEEQQRKLAEEQRQREEEEQQRRWEEEQQRRMEEEQQRKLAEEQQRKEEEEQQRRWEEEEKRRQEEEDRRRWEEEEEERRWQEEQERKREEELARSRVENGEPDAGDQFYYDEKEQQPPPPGQRWDDEEEKRAEQMMLQEEEEFMREQEEMRKKAELERQKREDERRRIEQHRLEIENQRARLQQASQDHSPPAPPAVHRPSPQPRQPPQDHPEEEWDAEEERARIEAAAKQHQRLMEEEERRRRQRRAEEQENRRMEEAGNVPDIRPLPRGPQERPGSENQPHWLIEEAERRRLQDQGQPRAPGIIEPLPPLVKPQPKNRHSMHGPPTGPPSHPPPDVPRRIHPNRSDEDVQARMINRRSAPPERTTSQGPIPDHIKDALTQRATRPQQSPPSRPVGGGKSVSGRKLCTHCGEPLGRGAAMIIESLALFYHITCFRCSVCGIQLGNGQQGTDVRIRANALHCSNCYSNEKDHFTALV
ncbi:PREDICTED: trichohyalin-like isoform X6 [Branchiostoma belcheri]|uniref:Trichohyalin-like isoform X6 n=1 Tax=Branchiostoma belcheri TaxID=7741 RepID=A0A6P5AM28_BRABE|nr:PREDICTED: trichohyalin-like isoform X6 [Branchiostoma belcheri]